MIVVESGARRRIGEFLGEAAQVAVITSANLRQHADEVAGFIGLGGPEPLVIEVPAGEAGKRVDVLAYCWEALAEANFTRSDLVVGLGGGATTDLAGFVGATYLRGIDVITMPTTVLAMVDAAVGGKTGIDLVAGKNLVGAFHTPRAVLADLDLLVGLPEAEVRSGLAEVVKCGFIDDPAILDLVEEAPDEALDVTSARCAELIRRGIAVKEAVVAVDLRESTSTTGRVGRERLNYGHTYGHAIEAASGYTLRHGEAISVGMVFAAELAHRETGLSAEIVARHRDILTMLGLPTTHDVADWQTLRDLMARDKKTRGATLRFVVLDGIGDVQILRAPDEATLRDVHDLVTE